MDSHDPYDEMPVHDERVPEEQFADFLEQMPQVCVEVVLETDEGVLLAKRTGEPELWFWPGSRLYKGERLSAAAHRVAREELGIEVELRGRLGIYEHRWHGSPVKGSPSRHTVNVVFRATPADETFDVTLDDQHAAYRFVTGPEPGLHEYVREYLDDLGRT